LVQNVVQYPCDILAQLDSTVSKDSRDIKFAKFGPAEHFILILQDSAQFEDI
jgi:hypothetical protein